MQIDGSVLDGKHELILNDSANTLNLDSGGSGCALDKIEIREAGDYHPNWKIRNERLDNDAKWPGR